ncbi:MAG TPA: ABC transporter ATP-binding protein, partial [Desulfomonilia bacterium]|nr:ABC transporter ATP-binding protein [Desulfomonilia bacterium]
STHILSEAEATCDRIVIIDRGRIVADGSTEMLTMGTGQEKTIHLAFRGADPARARDLLSGMAGVTCVEEVPSGTPDELRMTIFTAGESDLREDIYRAVRATDWILLELRQEGKSLEKIFRELTREE